MANRNYRDMDDSTPRNSQNCDRNKKKNNDRNKAQNGSDKNKSQNDSQNYGSR